MMSRRPLFTIISVYENIFFRQKKIIKILSIGFFICEKYERNKRGRRQTGKRNFLVYLLKLESDTATSKNIAIISFIPKFTITSY